MSDSYIAQVCFVVEGWWRGSDKKVGLVVVPVGLG